MNSLILRFYLFKKLIDELENHIKEKLSYNDNDLINYLVFKETPKYYSKKDKYDLYNKFNNNFVDFIVEASIILYKENNFNNLLFLYGLIISNIVIEDEDIDLFVTKNYDIKLPKNDFKYNEEMDELVHNPCIKIYSFFCSLNYFKRAYKKYKKAYYKYVLYEDKEIENKDKKIGEIYKFLKRKIDALNTYLLEFDDKDFRKEFNINKDKKI